MVYNSKIPQLERSRFTHQESAEIGAVQKSEFLPFLDSQKWEMNFKKSPVVGRKDVLTHKTGQQAVK